MPKPFRHALAILGGCLFFWGYLAFLPGPVRGEISAVEEYTLKAVYLYNFLHFVRWPVAQAQEGEDTPLVIGVVGESPFGSALDDLEDSLRKNGKGNLKVIYYGPYHASMDLRGCHLLFLGASEKKIFPAILTRLRGAPVLTVADVEPFLSMGGMIGLVRVDSRIRWTINRSAVEQAGLRLNAQLLQLALQVVDESTGLERR